jgi:cation diffusion facilitator family transporter
MAVSYSENKVMHNEKLKIALTSILASAGLTVLKFVVGISTNSLSILAEAMHSALDVIAAVMTFYAVRMVMRPPDVKYTYGYAKYESLSSLAQILLLFATASWIFYEAIARILFKLSRPEITIFSFTIMFVSIGIDYARSKKLYKVAKMYGSQALEADALHFKADLFSSAIVIGGLILVTTFEISDADAYAAIAVSAVIIYTSLGLGRRTLDVLLDRAPKGAYQRVLETVSGLEGVSSAHDIRVRRIGVRDFVDMHIEVPRTSTHEMAHRIATNVENRVRNVLPNSDVLVHVDAIESVSETIRDRIRLIAAETDGITNVHSIYLSRMSNPNLLTEGKSAEDKIRDDLSYVKKNRMDLHLYLDVQMSNTLDLDTAHAIVDHFETRIKHDIPVIVSVTTHIESEIGKDLMVGIEKKPDDPYIDNIRKIALSVDGLMECRDIGVIDISGEIHITLTIKIKSKKNENITTIDEAHRIATDVQNSIAKEIGASRVIVHTEPS